MLPHAVPILSHHKATQNNIHLSWDVEILSIYTTLELQPDDWLTMYYYGEVLGRQRKMEESKDMFRLAAETEIKV